ncbi:MAG: hypothetical protein KDC53_23070 [Saprospiraceae bacterium]|nr:hypothetical protein [Saprospiraceae bacterium]
MRVTFTLILPPIALLLLNYGTVQCQIPSEWRQVIDKNNVQVYLHECHQQNVRAFRAVTSISLPIDSVEVLFDAVEEYPSWQQNVKEAKVVHRASDSRYHFYTRNHQGWPSKDRDLIWAVEKKWDSNTASLVYDQVCSTNTLPDKGNSGIASQAFVTWRLQPVSETETRISYNFTIQQGGRIPNWLLSMLTADEPYKTLSNLRDLEIKGDGNTASLD